MVSLSELVWAFFGVGEELNWCEWAVDLFWEWCCLCEMCWNSHFPAFVGRGGGGLTDLGGLGSA